MEHRNRGGGDVRMQRRSTATRTRVRQTGRRETRARALALLLCLLLVSLSACAEIPASRAGESGEEQDGLPPETELTPPETPPETETETPPEEVPDAPPEAPPPAEAETETPPEEGGGNARAARHGETLTWAAGAVHMGMGAGVSQNGKLFFYTVERQR
jgi:hypothetical protein